MPEPERLRWVSKASLSKQTDGILLPPKLLALRSSSLREVRLKSAGSMPLLYKPKPPRLSEVTWPVELLQPTPSQIQQSVPACQEGRVVMESNNESSDSEFEWNMKDCLSLSRALA
ncbi:hypothetical protein PVAP13_3KG531590 [Panicum virgatum]|uniref:Uncharacterized protein n=1 Tax=Panicum virgatum TaxID=38727 RepID=A0A8T0V5N0_PANVG|nr:hypothetical protein PVAP13_3KG531590 [Panicum virgatum]